MKHYLFKAEGQWILSYENPGGDEDTHIRYSEKMEVEYEMENDEAAIHKAKLLLEEFKKSLPKSRKNGGLSWQDQNAEIVSSSLYLKLTL